jgi:hypothetical protein
MDGLPLVDDDLEATDAGDLLAAGLGGVGTDDWRLPRCRPSPARSPRR